MAGLFADKDLEVNIRRIANAPKPTTTPAVGGGGLSRVQPPSRAQLNPRLQKLMAVSDTVSAPKKDDGGFSLGDAFGAAGQGLMKVLDVADMPRRAYQGLAGEVGDLVENIPGNTPVEYLANTLLGNPFQLRGLADEDGNRDTSFDSGEIRRSVTGDNAMMNGFMGRATWDDSLPAPLRGVVGFAGDLATDPLTYLTAGTVKTATVGGKAGLSAGRKTLAMDLADVLTDRALKESGSTITREAADKLITEAGKRGFGSLTERGLQRAGVSAQELAQMGIERQFKASVGVGNKRLNIAGTGKIAEKAQDFKGGVKAAWGKSGTAKLGGELFRSARHSERQFTNELLRGGADAADAARSLALLRLAKTDSRAFLSRAIAESGQLTGSDGRGLSKLSPDESSALTRAIEAGDMNHPLVKEFTDFFEKIGVDLQGMGAPFNMRTKYVPHRLSEKAVKALETGDPDVARYLDATIKKEQAFQKVRQSEESIDEINAAWRASGHDYDLLETDFKKLLTTYLGEAQEAALRGRMTGEMAREYGFVKDLTETLDNKAVDKAVDELAAKELEAIRKTASKRSKAITQAKAVARRDKALSRQRLDDATTAAADARRRADDALQGREVAERELDQLNRALKLKQLAANTASGKDKARLTRELKALEAQVEKAGADIDVMVNQYNRAEKDFGRLADEIKVAEDDYAAMAARYDEVEAERIRAESEPISGEAQDAVTEVAIAAAARDQAVRNVSDATDAVDVATNAVGWLDAEAAQLSDVMGRRIADVLEWQQKVGKERAKRKRFPKLDDYWAEADELASRMKEIRDALARAPKGDKNARVALQLEAQAAAAEAAALTARDAGASLKTLQTEFNNGLRGITDPVFQDYVMKQVDAGYNILKQNGVDVQIRADYDEAIQRMEKFIDPSTRGVAFQKAYQAMRKYQKALNWWKGWAVASPGFVLRNMYSGMFNMYLDDIPTRYAGKYFRFWKATEAMDDDAAFKWAVQHGRSAEDAELLVQARKISAGTGAGQTLSEFGEGLAAKVGWNPLSATNKVTHFFRKGGEFGEAALRGGHAYGVLKRGGTANDAFERVQKFHFNYGDISEFDRSVKNVVPFWTFFSRNIALQAAVFAKRPQKITRSYYNAMRNMEALSEDSGVPIPDFLRSGMQAIRTPFGSPTGRGELYATPDIPSVRFPGVVDGLLSNPLGEVGLTPAVGTPLKLLANRDFFTDREYKNDLTTYDSSGEIPRYAPTWAQLPGIRQGLDMLPGTETIDGKLLMQDNVQAAVESVNPTLSRFARLFPNTERQEETYRQYWLNFLGAPLRWNDPGSQAGAIAAAKSEDQAAADKVQERIRLEGLVSGG